MPGAVTDVSVRRPRDSVVELALPEQRLVVHPAVPSLRSATVLIAAPGRSTWVPLTARLLGMGVGRVLRAESVGAVDAVIASGTPGELALVSVAFHTKKQRLIRDLRKAGWSRVLALATRSDSQSVLDAMAAGASGMLSDSHAYPDAAALELTRRQTDILRLLAEGLSKKRMARDLGLSASRLDKHLARISRALGTADRAGMVGAAMRAGLVH